MKTFLLPSIRHVVGVFVLCCISLVSYGQGLPNGCGLTTPFVTYSIVSGGGTPPAGATINNANRSVSLPICTTACSQLRIRAVLTGSVTVGTNPWACDNSITIVSQTLVSGSWEVVITSNSTDSTKNWLPGQLWLNYTGSGACGSCSSYTDPLKVYKSYTFSATDKNYSYRQNDLIGPSGCFAPGEILTYSIRSRFTFGQGVLRDNYTWTLPANTNILYKADDNSSITLQIQTGFIGGTVTCIPGSSRPLGTVYNHTQSFSKYIFSGTARPVTLAASNTTPNPTCISSNTPLVYKFNPPLTGYQFRVAGISGQFTASINSATNEVTVTPTTTPVAAGTSGSVTIGLISTSGEIPTCGTSQVVLAINRTSSVTVSPTSAAAGCLTTGQLFNFTATGLPGNTPISWATNPTAGTGWQMLNVGTTSPSVIPTTTATSTVTIQANVGTSPCTTLTNYTLGTNKLPTLTLSRACDGTPSQCNRLTATISNITPCTVNNYNYTWVVTDPTSGTETTIASGCGVNFIDADLITSGQTVRVTVSNCSTSNCGSKCIVPVSAAITNNTASITSWACSQGECDAGPGRLGNLYEPETSAGKGLVLAPNPTQDMFSVSVSETDEKVLGVEVSDANGKTIIRGEKSENISTRGLSKGSYYVRVVTTAGTYNTMLVKE